MSDDGVRPPPKYSPGLYHSADDELVLCAFDLARKHRAHLKARGGPRGAAAYLRSVIDRDMDNAPIEAELQVADLERRLADARAQAAAATADASKRRQAAWGDLVAMKAHTRTEAEFIDWCLHKRIDMDTPGQKFLRIHHLSLAQAIELYREVKAAPRGP